MTTVFTEDDEKFINQGRNDEEKANRRVAITNVLDMNGMKFEPGIAKSFLPPKNYYVRISIDKLPENVLKIAEIAMNYVALGGGIGGLAGAGIRWKLRDRFKPNRECRIVSEWSEEIMEAMNQFNAAYSVRKETTPFWIDQAVNVLGLSAAIFNRELHHWNADNTRPQRALLGALGQIDEIPETEYRKIFYLAIHPVPLISMEELRCEIAEGKVPGVSDVVTVRCRNVPATLGDVHACAQAVTDVKTEGFYEKFGNKLKAQMEAVTELNTEVIANASSYHPFAASYERKRIIVDKSPYKKAMIMLAAYIMVYVKGSLAKAASLRKFQNENSRQVRRWIEAFETEVAQVEGANSIIVLSAD